MLVVWCLQSFTCIVGPNGSGKSNVIDAMLFVFGFRANKIRSKKLSVLIHNSERHQNITSCTVKVHFQRIIDTGVCRLNSHWISTGAFVEYLLVFEPDYRAGVLRCPRT